MRFGDSVSKWLKRFFAEKSLGQRGEIGQQELGVRIARRLDLRERGRAAAGIAPNEDQVSPEPGQRDRSGLPDAVGGAGDDDRLSCD